VFTACVYRSRCLVQVIAERRWSVDTADTTAAASSRLLTTTSDLKSDPTNALSHFGVNTITSEGDHLSVICFPARARDGRLALYARSIQLIKHALTLSTISLSSSDDQIATSTNNVPIPNKRVVIKYVNDVTT
jgi:hypothetical protein